MTYTKSFPLYPAITNPTSEKAPIAEFRNPAAYRLKPEGENYRFFIPAQIYGFLLKKTESLIKRLGKMEDRIIELNKYNSVLTRRNEGLVIKLRAKEGNCSFQTAKLRERDNEIVFKQDIIDALAKKVKELEIKVESPTPQLQAATNTPLIDVQRRTIQRLENTLYGIRQALAGEGWVKSYTDAPPVPVTSGYITEAPAKGLGGLGQAALDKIKDSYQTRAFPPATLGPRQSAGNVGINLNPNIQVVNTPTLNYTVTNGIVTDVKDITDAKPPVEGYARSISNGIKAGDTSRFDARLRFSDAYGRR